MVESNGYDALCLNISDRDVLGIAAVHGDRTYCRSSGAGDGEHYIICGDCHTARCLQKNLGDRTVRRGLGDDGGAVGSCGSHYRHIVATVGRCVALLQSVVGLQRGEVCRTDSHAVYRHVSKLWLSAHGVIRNLDICEAAAAVACELYLLIGVDTRIVEGHRLTVAALGGVCRCAGDGGALYLARVRVQLNGAVRRYRQSEHGVLVDRTASLSHHAALVCVHHRAAAAVNVERQVYLGSVDIELVNSQTHRVLVIYGWSSESRRQRPLYGGAGCELSARNGVCRKVRCQ